jgi:hypothetical protein
MKEPLTQARPAPGAPRRGAALFAALFAAALLLLHAWRAHAPAPALDAGLPLPAGPPAAAGLADVAGAAARLVGWPVGMRFARFEANTTLEAALAAPALQRGALVLVVAGPPGRTPRRRAAGEPVFAAAGAEAAAALPLAALKALGAAIERVRGGAQMHAFEIGAAPLPLCSSARGACAVWEGGTGRVVLDAALLARVAAAPSAPARLDAFARRLAELLPLSAAGGASAAGVAAALVGAAAAALAAPAPPLWFCLLCPAVLGLLAPFVLNWGLTSAAEELCAALALPAGDCADLWWAAFALALVLSLGAALPIVYACHLPECAHRRPAAAGGG